MEMEIFCIIPANAPYIEYINSVLVDSGREFPFNNVNLCENMLWKFLN